MRINANSKLTANDLYNAAHRARQEFGQDIYISEIVHSPTGRISDFYCESMNGRYATGRNNGSGKAATWTAYGYLIAHLFTIDPDSRIGQYHGRDHFIRSIYSEQRRYIIRESLGVTNRQGSSGSNCEFLSLFNDELLTERYNEMR